MQDQVWWPLTGLADQRPDRGFSFCRGLPQSQVPSATHSKKSSSQEPSPVFSEGSTATSSIFQRHMGHLAVSLKTCQAQEAQKCEWPQGMRRVLAVLWKQITHSSPDMTGKQESIGQGYTWRVGHPSLTTGQESSVSRGTGFPVKIYSMQLHENLQNTHSPLSRVLPLSFSHLWSEVITRKDLEKKIMGTKLLLLYAATVLLCY